MTWPCAGQTPAAKPAGVMTAPVEAEKTSIATFYGYDFQDYSKVSAFTANVEYDGDVVAMAGVGHVSVATNYQMSVDVQAVDFGGLDRSRGPRLVLRWNADPVSAYSGGAAALPILVPVPKVPRTSTVSFLVSQHARNGGLFSGGQCLSVDTTYNVAAGWVVDTTKGDPYHPGISETSVRDNQQSKNSLRAYNYKAISMTAVTVSGIAAACASKALALTLKDGSGASLGTGSVASISGTSAVVPIGGVGANANAVVGTAIVISG